MCIVQSLDHFVLKFNLLFGAYASNHNSSLAAWYSLVFSPLSCFLLWYSCFCLILSASALLVSSSSLCFYSRDSCHLLSSYFFLWESFYHFYKELSCFHCWNAAPSFKNGIISLFAAPVIPDTIILFKSLSRIVSQPSLI